MKHLSKVLGQNSPLVLILQVFVSTLLKDLSLFAVYYGGGGQLCWPKVSQRC